MEPMKHISMSLEGNSQLDAVGQNVDGHAFVSLAVNASELQTRRFGVVAVTKGGRELVPSGGATSGSGDGTGVSSESFEFEMPLDQVARFRIGTRPVRVMEWKDVLLPTQPSKSEAAQSKRQRFVRNPVLAVKSSWGVIARPSQLNPKGWAIMTHLTLGSVVPARMPGATNDFCRIEMTDGNDDWIKLKIEDLTQKSVLNVTLNRDQNAEILVDGKGYRVAYPSRSWR